MNEQKTWVTAAKYLILVLVLFSMGFAGWKYTANRKAEQGQQASLAYDKLLNTIRNKNTAKAEEQGLILIKQYEKTPYSSLAALLLGRLYLEQNKLDKSADFLREAVRLSNAHSNKGPVEHIARVRLARLLSSQDNFEEALAVLETKNSNKGYVTLYEEIKGDIFVLKNDLTKAKEAYTAALDAVPAGVPVTGLQLKLSDLNTRGDS
jgi:predicted negative regulator of RcsB-dependent stress response